MGRSQGGLTTKIHAVVDADGLPVTLELSAGQLHDSKPALQMLKGVPEGCITLVDKAYDSDALRDMAKDKDAWANIPQKVNRKKVFSFSKWVYRQRNLVERFFAKIKQYRGIATRCDKVPANFLTAIKLAAIRLWIKSYVSALQGPLKIYVLRRMDCKTFN